MAPVVGRWCDEQCPISSRLVRATGKKSKPVAVRRDDGSYAKAAHRERQKDDFEPTPPEPTRAFLAAEIARLQEFSCIWEPAAGDGAMAREMVAAGLKVWCSDLVDRGCGAHIQSFYDFGVRPSPAIVTNPPFSECGWGNARARWISHALDMMGVEYMALLLPWQWPGAAGMRAFYEAHKPARIYLMCWRIDFSGQGAQPALHAWFVWDRKSAGETTLHMLYRNADARQSTLALEAVP